MSDVIIDTVNKGRKKKVGPKTNFGQTKVFGPK